MCGLPSSVTAQRADAIAGRPVPSEGVHQLVEQRELHGSCPAVCLPWAMTSAGPSASGSDGMPLFTAAFVALSVAELAYFTAFGLLIPVVPLFAADPLGAGPAGWVWRSGRSA